MTWEGQEENYNIFRWYRSAWRQYTQPDPIELEGGINLFAYAASNPTRYSDRFGLDTAGCDSYMWNLETKCELECCAQHDKCFDDNNCSSGSWPGAKPKCGCDQHPRARAATPPLVAVSVSARLRRTHLVLRARRNIIVARSISSSKFRETSQAWQELRKPARWIIQKTARFH
jgi:uncharacterized protein RhaS with RHS repeats